MCVPSTPPYQAGGAQPIPAAVPVATAYGQPQQAYGAPTYQGAPPAQPAYQGVPPAQPTYNNAYGQNVGVTPPAATAPAYSSNNAYSNGKY